MDRTQCLHGLFLAAALDVDLFGREGHSVCIGAQYLLDDRCRGRTRRGEEAKVVFARRLDWD